MKENIQSYLVKIALSIFSILCLISCLEPINYEEKLKGDWINKIDIDNSNREIQAIFTFEDSLCSLQHPLSNMMSYQLKKDRITVEVDTETWLRLNKEDKFQLRVKLETDSTMFLKRVDSLTKQNLKIWEKEFDTVKLFKVKIKHQLRFKRIAFYSSVSHGRPPRMYFEIDDKRNLYFHGKKHTTKNGFFKAQIPINQYDAIVRKVQQIELDSLKEIYYSGASGAQLLEVIIQTEDGYYKSGAYGFDKEPIELRILNQRLMNIYKSVDLIKDENIELQFRFKEMMEQKNYLFQNDKN